MNADLSDALADSIIRRVIRDGHVGPDEWNWYFKYLASLRNDRPRPPK